MKNRLKVLRAERDWSQQDLADALAVSRRCEESIHETLVGVRPFVGQKRVELVRGGRQSGQVQRHSSNQLFSARLGPHAVERVLLELSQHELVDRGRGAAHLPRGQDR